MNDDPVWSYWVIFLLQSLKKIIEKIESYQVENLRQMLGSRNWELH